MLGQKVPHKSSVFQHSNNNVYYSASKSLRKDKILKRKKKENKKKFKKIKFCSMYYSGV